MSDLVFPPFNGFAFDRKRNPEFKTSIKTTASGREVRQRLSAYPLWYFVLPIGVLANNRASTEYDELQGFFLTHNGQLDTWLYNCPNYNTATEQYLGTGNAARVSFQLKITHRHGFIEPTHYPKANPQIYIDDVLQESGYTVSSSGLVTFATPPATDAVVR